MRTSLSLFDVLFAHPHTALDNSLAAFALNVWAFAQHTPIEWGYSATASTLKRVRNVEHVRAKDAACTTAAQHLSGTSD